MDHIIYIALTQSFFSGLMIATKKPRTIADELLSAWLFLITVEMIFALINMNVLSITAYTVMPYSYGPLMYLYVYYQTHEHPCFKWVQLSHFLPFIALFILSVIYRNKPVLNLNEFFNLNDLSAVRFIYGITFFLSIICYSTASFVLIVKHQKRIKELFSYKSHRNTLNWLKLVSICFTITYLLMFMVGGVEILFFSIDFDPILISYYGLTFFAFAFSFYGFKQAAIFAQLHEKETISKQRNHTEQKDKYKRSGLKKPDALKYISSLKKYMEEEKPFLKGDLTIQDIANDLNISRHYLTQIFNEYLHKNFFTFINEYRVEEAKSKLRDASCEEFTLSAIGYDSGFNSKTAFNTVFKKYTGMTPGEYKSKQE